MSIIHKKFIKPRLPRIVVTGPPGSGKTSIVNMFRDEFAHTIQCVPEVATLAIVGLGVTPDKPENRVVYKSIFLHLLYKLQILVDHISEEVARDMGRKVVLMDKTLVDVVGHLPGKNKEYKELFNTTVEKDYKNYDLVLFLELPTRKVFNEIRKNNPARSENYEASKRNGILYKKAWQGHPNIKYINNDFGWDGKVAQARLAVKDFLKEIKRSSK
ncbi:MAG: AAA family ATPase [bacterium]|nr:AAA family ATPase [bacterium]